MSTEFRSSVEKNAVKCIGIRIHHLETDSNLFATIRKCVARVLPNGLLLTFSFLFVLLAFGSIAQAFTQEDIHCPITNEWKQQKTNCPCRLGWTPRRELLDKIIADHALWSQQSRSNRANTPGRAVLCNAVIFNADFRGAKLEESMFSGARMMNARFDDAELHFADFSSAHLMNASFNNSRMQTSNFRNSELHNATFNGTYMPYTNFRTASLINATFNAVESDNGDDTTTLWSADYTNADLRNTQFIKAQLRGAKLVNANLDGATLKHANLRKTVVTGTRFSAVDLTGALYAPVSPPPENNFAGLVGLHTVTFPEGEQTGLVQLRGQLRRSGLRSLEREATFAIENNKVSHKLQAGAVYEKIGALAELVFFGWTVGWGFQPGRAFLILLGFLVLLAPIYSFSIATNRYDLQKRSGIYRIWQRERLEVDQSGISVRNDIRVERLSGSILRVLLWGCYFSLLSAFHIGWRDINVGTWLARLQFREFAIRGYGWTRTLSGIQSLTSVYLLAMWILSEFGRPFE